MISIHALLAESDHRGQSLLLPGRAISIHALLAESDGASPRSLPGPYNFNPRSPCGERHQRTGQYPVLPGFQSTLSLRRATGGVD